MTELVYKKARLEAEKLRDVCWDGRFPVALQPITDELNAELYRADLGDGLSGVVSKDEGKRARIVLNSRHVERRNRFIWAHELGHIVEREMIANDSEYSFEELTHGGSYDLHEFFADEFAGALLMPAAAITQLRSGGATLEEMAEYFNVSVSAVKRWLDRLHTHPE